MYPSSCSYYQLAVVTAETMAAEGLKEVQEEEEHRALAERSKSTMPAYEDHSGVSARKATSKQSPSADHKDKGGGGCCSVWEEVRTVTREGTLCKTSFKKASLWQLT